MTKSPLLFLQLSFKPVPFASYYCYSERILLKISTFKRHKMFTFHGIVTVHAPSNAIDLHGKDV